MLRQISEADGIRLTCRGKVQYAVITCQLAFNAEASFYPEQNRVQRKNDQSDLLKEICPIVSTAKVLHLVQNDLLKFLLRKSLEQRRGNKNSRPEKSHDTGAIDFGRDAKHRGSAPLGKKSLAGSIRFTRRGGGSDAPQLDDILDEPDRSHQGETCP
jgi:hypothetical protein